MGRAGLLAYVSVFTLAAAPAVAAEASGGSAEVSEVVVTAQRLDAARAAVEPALGASSYTLPQAFIETLPGGANSQLNRIVLQAPGVAQDSFGQLHVRGDHGNIQYRLNNVILPEGLQVFGQALSPRLASSIELITGALPAQYGLRTAGVINITTKSGFRTGGEASIYGGGHNVITPSLEYGGSWGSNSAFAAASYTGTDVGLESPDGSRRPLHDHSDQYQAFAYLDRILDPQSRISAIVGTSQQTFEIPNLRGLQPSLGLSLAGRTAYPSEALDQRQREGTTYAIATYLKTTDRFTGQASAFLRYSRLSYRPDVAGELLFNGIAQAARKADLATGVQLEGALNFGAAHTARFGAIASTDRTTSRTRSQVFRMDPGGGQISDVPVTIADDTRRRTWSWSAYLQDEWKLSDRFTVNYGARFDLVRTSRAEHQLSPRINAVWTPFAGTTVHAGYARYFTPPPYGLTANETIAKFAGTSAQPPGTLNDPPRAERDHYFDAGVEQKLGPLTLGLDAYYKRAKNLLDEGQFGAPIILTPFNYRTGYAKGIEASASFESGPLSAYLNVALSRARGKGVASSQFNFDPDDLAYIEDHAIFLDHDQTWTISGGATRRFGASRIAAEVIFGSGLRRDGAVPNGSRLPSYLQVNLSLAHDFPRVLGGPLTVRADVINLFDERYEIRDGTGVGVGAPQWGPRRGVFVGVSKAL